VRDASQLNAACLYPPFPAAAARDLFGTAVTAQFSTRRFNDIRLAYIGKGLSHHRERDSVTFVSTKLSIGPVEPGGPGSNLRTPVAVTARGDF
jgi:hypothetical protein